ncbi:Hpt domain-containing protein [Spirulina subsalsa]|uniref:Hpt domain-containing protein n=1 Tax=Spirulina subsalsa TaxID=54311 RepID=UPI0003081D88|nr:Hpt domain-containing protein [Spirulina subsalsa]
MFIEDEELRNLFKAASEEHLQKLEAGLLHLERNPEDKSPFEELLREAHSLKGDSRMLGLKDIETLTHQIEHNLGQLYREETTLTPEFSDRLYQGLDAIAKLVEESVTGNPSGVDTFHLLAVLMGANPTQSQAEPPPEPDSPTPDPPRRSCRPRGDRKPRSPRSPPRSRLRNFSR